MHLAFGLMGSLAEQLFREKILLSDLLLLTGSAYVRYTGL